MPYKDKEQAKIHSREYYRKRYQTDEAFREYSKEKRKKTYYNTLDSSKMRDRAKKESALSIIASYHNHSLECWRCHENRIFLLTLGHLDKDKKKEDVKLFKNRAGLITAIINGNRCMDDLEVECYNCNISLEMNGLYPDEMTEDLWRKGKQKPLNT